MPVVGDAAWSTLEQRDDWEDKTIEIELTTVDAEVGRLGLRPAVVKIDVEGHELAVLSGMEATLDVRPAVVCEVGAVDATLVERIFTARDYRAYRVVGRRLVAGSLEGAPGVFNAIFLPAERQSAAS